MRNLLASQVISLTSCSTRGDKGLAGVSTRLIKNRWNSKLDLVLLDGIGDTQKNLLASFLKLTSVRIDFKVTVHLNLYMIRLVLGDDSPERLASVRDKLGAVVLYLTLDFL